MGSWWFHDDKPSNLWFSLKPKFLPGMEWEWTFSWPFLVALVMNHPHYIPTIWKTLVKSSMIYHLVGGFMKKQYMWDWLRRWLLHFCWHGLFFFNHQQWLDHGRAFGETRLPLQRFGVSHPRGSRAGGSLALGVFRQCEKRPLDRYKKRGYQICGCSIRAMPNYVSLPWLPALPCDLKLGDYILYNYCKTE